MKRLLCFVWPFAPAILMHGAPLAVYPANPHYLLWRGHPEVIITSGEHYGSVLNLDFNYRRYLATLAKDKLNGTRLWAGTYAETAGNFKIAHNTLSPAAGRLITPWARSGEPGAGDGGNKFDLTRWNDVFFKRLKDFVGCASRKGIVVEVNLFCPMYEESMWAICPMNARNNINGLGNVSRHEPLTLRQSGGLLPVQEALVRKFATELSSFDNVYFEIVNEPYATKPPVSDGWQRHLTEVLSDAMKGWRQPFLISWNIANGRAKVAEPHPAVSLFNFHYATPPDAVALNWSLDKPIGDNETGFRGTNNTPYRCEAWDFILAGGTLFNHLDYSFTVGHEDGTFVYPADQPGGGNATLRRQFRILRDFIHSFNFARMKPDESFIRGGIPVGGSARALVEPGNAYAIYIRRAAPGSKSAPSSPAAAITLQISLPDGGWSADWLDPLSGKYVAQARLDGAGVRSLASPPFGDDVALRITRTLTGENSGRHRLSGSVQ
jgi:hypothetical protein